MKPAIARQLEEDLDDALLLLSQFERIHTRMADRVPDVAAQAYDTGSGGGSGRAVLAWCDTHGREVPRCRVKGLHCLGVSPPRVVDPTGDAVTARIWDDAAAMRRGAELVHIGVAAMLEVARTYDRDDTKDDARATATLEELNRPKCQVHLRHGWLVDAQDKEPTRIRHRGIEILDVAYRLCRWCKDDTRERFIETGERRIPQAWEVDRHARRAQLQPAHLHAATA